MPNQNPYLIPKTEEVREIPTYQPKYTDEEVARLKEIFIAEQKETIKKYQIKRSPLSPEARSKVIRKWGGDYVSENREEYGPCKNSLCGCNCLSSKCICGGGEASVYDENGFKIANFSSSGRVKDGSVGWNGRSGEVGGSVFRIKDHTGDLKFFSGSVGGEIVDENNVKVKLGVDVMNFKSDGVQLRAGLNVDTGFSNGSDGVEVKLAGFGVTFGNQVGISTPIGEIKIDKDNCVVQ